MRTFWIPAFAVAALAASAMPSFAEGQTITITHAIANNGSDPSGAREITLKERLASRCNGREACTQRAEEIVPEKDFVIEVIYDCRAGDGSGRQIGPKQFGSADVVQLSCE